MDYTNENQNLKLTLLLDPNKELETPNLFVTQRDKIIHIVEQAIYLGLAAFNLAFSSYFETLKILLRITRTAQIPLLALFLLINIKQRKLAFQNFIIVGMIFAAIADYEFTYSTSFSFIFAILCLSVTQVFYMFGVIYNFVYVKLQKLKIQYWAIIIIVVMLAYIPASCVLFVKKVKKPFQTPIIIYIILLQIMVSSTMLRHNRTCWLSFWLFFVGGVLLSISDNLLGYFKFDRFKAKYNNVVTLITYYVGQDLIYFATLYHTQWLVEKYNNFLSVDQPKQQQNSNIEIVK